MVSDKCRSLPRTQTSLSLDENVRAKEGGKKTMSETSLRLPSVPFPWSLEEEAVQVLFYSWPSDGFSPLRICIQQVAGNPRRGRIVPTKRRKCENERRLEIQRKQWHSEVNAVNERPRLLYSNLQQPQICTEAATKYYNLIQTAN